MESEKPRKEIMYYENSMQPIQIRNYKNNTLHNINEPALILYNKDGSIYSKSYFVEGLLSYIPYLKTIFFRVYTKQ